MIRRFAAGTHLVRAPRTRVSVRDTVGLRPFNDGVRQCLDAIRGDAWAPPAVWDLSGLRILSPGMGLALWAGLARADRRAPITALPNRTPADPTGGYRVTTHACRDFRGRRMSYDSHLGTDFALPPGTRICTAAAGVVRSVRNDMQRGGLKVIVDHGGALVTTYNHLARALVQPGDRLPRGAVIGLSGMSAVDGVLFSPWLAPHLHLNVLLDGVAVDPFAEPGETSLWRSEDNHPTPPVGTASPAALPPSAWDHDAVNASVQGCLDPGLAAALAGEAAGDARAVAVVAARFFFRHRFRDVPPLVRTPSPRTPRLDLPLHPDDYVGVIYVDGHAP